MTRPASTNPGSLARRTTARGTSPVAAFVPTEGQRVHRADHAKMAIGSPESYKPLQTDEYERIKSNAQAGCLHCGAFVAGAQKATAAGREKARLAAENESARSVRPTTTRGFRAAEQSRRRYELEVAAAGDRAVAQLEPLPGEHTDEFISRQALTRARAESAWRGTPYGTTAPVPTTEQTYSFKESGQSHKVGGPAGNGSVSAIITVQPQSVGKRVLYNTQDAAALEAGVPAAAEERPSPTDSISLNPGQFHEGGHKVAGLSDRETHGGQNTAPGAEFDQDGDHDGAIDDNTTVVARPPRPTPIAPAVPTVKNGGTPSTGSGQVNTLAQRRRQEQLERAAGDRALTPLPARLPQETDMEYRARLIRIRGEAELEWRRQQQQAAK